MHNKRENIAIAGTFIAGTLLVGQTAQSAKNIMNCEIDYPRHNCEIRIPGSRYPNGGFPNPPQITIVASASATSVFPEDGSLFIKPK